MNPLIVIIIMVIFFPVLLIFWNRQRVKGKVLCFIVRKDKSVLQKLCQLRDSFILWENKGYEVYPDFVRLCRFPMGWPPFLQELVPTLLIDEEDRVPLDWIMLGERQGSAMSLRAALDENWIRKLVEQGAKGPNTLSGINWRKILPIALIGVGVLALIVLFVLKGCGGA